MSNVVNLEEKRKNEVLELFETACRQASRVLAAAKNVEEVMKANSMADVVMGYAKLAKDKRLMADAWEISQHAKRQLGIMLEEGKADRASVGGDRDRNRENPSSKPTLDEMGINKSMAHKARRLAELSERDYGLYLIDGRANVQHPIENAPALKKTKKKGLKVTTREYECPHCAKKVYLRGGKLETSW